MISAYGDESQDSKKERVFALGCLLGNAVQWKLLRDKWSRRIGDKVFHAADCESSRGDFKHATKEDNHRLHRSLTQILANSGIVGWGVAIDVAGRKLAFPDTSPDQDFISSFPRTVRYMAERASYRIPRETVTFTFDGHPTNEHLMRMLYSQVKGDVDWPRDPRVADEISFTSRKDIGIQAADLWVRELMKRMDGHLHGGDDYTPRVQWKTLEATKRFGGDLQIAEYFADMKRNMKTMEEKTGVNAAGYYAWLNKKNRHDNQPNRLEYASTISRLNKK